MTTSPSRKVAARTTALIVGASRPATIDAMTSPDAAICASIVSRMSGGSGRLWYHSMIARSTSPTAAPSWGS